MRWVGIEFSVVSAVVEKSCSTYTRLQTVCPSRLKADVVSLLKCFAFYFYVNVSYMKLVFRLVGVTWPVTGRWLIIYFFSSWPFQEFCPPPFFALRRPPGFRVNNTHPSNPKGNLVNFTISFGAGWCCFFRDTRAMC